MSSYQISSGSEKKRGSVTELFIKFAQTKDARIREELILVYRGLVEQLAKRYINRGRPFESLVAVGTIGLIKAIDRYDINREAKFTTYATHYILGEIKRYFRDKAWTLRVPRNLKELNAVIQRTIEDLTARFSRLPTTQEISQELDISSETVIEAIEAGRAYKPYSLEKKVESNEEDNICFLDTLSQDDEGKYRHLLKIDLKEAVKTLNKREQAIIQLFYFEGYSQTKIAQRLQISQMHVSRLLRGAIKNLKDRLKSTK